MNMDELDKYLIGGKETLVDAMQKIDQNTRGILFVVGDNKKLQGTLTDGDVRRSLIKNGNLKAEVAGVMNQNPKYVYATNIGDYRGFMKKRKLTALPVVTEDAVICDIVFSDEVYKNEIQIRNSLSEVPVVIMAGGKGTRLYPYTKVLPKPLIPVGDIPIMERIIHNFQEFGAKEFWVTLGYRKNMIKSYFGEVLTDLTLNYVEEEQPLGTAGSLHLISKTFSKPLIVTNCDILIQADYEDIYKYHSQSGNALTIVTALKNIVVPYGVVETKENGTITKMEEKPKLSYFVNTGMYVLNPDLLAGIPKDTFFHMTDLADMLLKAGDQVGMYPISEDSFLDMGEFEEMRRMEKKLNLKTE